MKVYSEKEIKNPLYIAKLDNDVTVFVYDGYADGSDGKKYFHVGREDENGDLELVGWSCEVKEPVLVR